MGHEWSSTADDFRPAACGDLRQTSTHSSAGKLIDFRKLDRYSAAFADYILAVYSVVRPHEATPTSNVMITSAIPVIAVSDSARAEDYYCRVLGFQKMFAYPPEATKPDPRYLGVARDGVWLHLQSYKPERAGMTDAFLWVADVDRLHDELSARGAVVQLPPTDQSWGTRETGIRDPDGNVLVFATKP